MNILALRQVNIRRRIYIVFVFTNFALTAKIFIFRANVPFRLLIYSTNALKWDVTRVYLIKVFLGSNDKNCNGTCSCKFVNLKISLLGRSLRNVFFCRQFLPLHFDKQKEKSKTATKRYGLSFSGVPCITLFVPGFSAYESNVCHCWPLFEFTTELMTLNLGHNLRLS